MPLFRFFASLFLLSGAGYIGWRALRTLGQGSVLIVTVPFWFTEFFSLALGFIFVMGLWRMIARPKRWGAAGRWAESCNERCSRLSSVRAVLWLQGLRALAQAALGLMPPGSPAPCLLAGCCPRCSTSWTSPRWTCWWCATTSPSRWAAGRWLGSWLWCLLGAMSSAGCSSWWSWVFPASTALPPAQIVEPTVIAALNMTYPESKLTVHVLDDGKRPDVMIMVNRLRSQCRWVQAAGGERAAWIPPARPPACLPGWSGAAGSIDLRSF